MSRNQHPERRTDFTGQSGTRNRAIVFVSNDRIETVGTADPHGETLDAAGLIVAPGIIDLGVFATDKPAFHFGGITRAALMPDQSPAHDDPATIRFAGRKGKPEFWVHPLAAATKGLDGLHMAEIALMKDAGARGVATGRRWIADSGIMLRLMRYCAMLDLPLFVHSEDAGLTGNAVATTGANATLLGLASASPAAEMLSIQRDLVLAEESGAHIHFRQVTTARGLDLDPRRKGKGLARHLWHHPCPFVPIRHGIDRIPHVRAAFTAVAQRG